MNDSCAIVSSHLLGRRKCRRYNLKCPVCLRFSSLDSFQEIEGTSRNVSILGLLVDSPIQVPIDSCVSFTLKLHGKPLLRSIQLAGDGRVRRVEPYPPEPRFTIAVVCEVPIGELDDLIQLPG